jgi:hypothetical protein
MSSVLNIAVTPRGTKDQGTNRQVPSSGPSVDIMAPDHIELRNGKLTKSGSWKKRPGASTSKNLSVDESIAELIPHNIGYAVTNEGKVFRFDKSTEITGARLTGGNRIQWDVYGNKIILCDGSIIVYIDTSINKVAVLSKDPSFPRAKFITRVGNVTLYAGHDPTQIVYSATDAPDDVSTASGGGTFDAQKTGETVRNMKSLRSEVYLFKDKRIEVFGYVGGNIPFRRIDGAWVEQGCGADYSVVKALGTFFWYGDDNRFYVLEGSAAREIPRGHVREAQKLSRPSEVYGIHFPTESVIRWFAPSDGKCFVYDYKNDSFSEDSAWKHGQNERLPIKSFMRFKNKDYYGDWEETGKIKEWSYEHQDDDGEPIRVERLLRVRPSTRGHRVRYDGVRFRFNRGISTSNAINRYLMFRYNPDEKGWSNYRRIDLGATGDYRPSIEERNLGTAREMLFHIVETDAVEHVMTHMELTVQELGR